MNSSLLGQNTHHWKEQAAYMFAKRSKNSPERRDLEKRKMRRMKTKNRADDVPLAAAGDYPILGDARSILAPYSPTANDESFLDRLLWENAARTDAGDLSLADRTASRTCRLPGLRYSASRRSPSVVSRYYSTNHPPSPSPLVEPVEGFSLLVDSLHSVSLLAQFLLENSVILVAFGCSILFLILADA